MRIKNRYKVNSDYLANKNVWNVIKGVGFGGLYLMYLCAWGLLVSRRWSIKLINFYTGHVMSKFLYCIYSRITSKTQLTVFNIYNYSHITTHGKIPYSKMNNNFKLNVKKKRFNKTFG